MNVFFNGLSPFLYAGELFVCYIYILQKYKSLLTADI